MFKKLASLVILIVLISACTSKVEETILIEDFGNTEDGASVHLYTLKNTHGMEVKITDFGGVVTSIIVPDKDGNMDNVVLGFDNIDDYLAGTPYFGALIGRYGNRIAEGKFTLN